VLTRRLALVRAMHTGAAQLIGLRTAQVVAVSPTASVRIHRPDSATDSALPAVLWIHGGGYVLGSARLDDRAARRLATELGALVASVEYRLAPENPYPAALDDCYAALQWLLTQPDVEARRVVIAGTSAGGGLAAALTLRAVDTGLKPAGQVLQYPMLDDRTVLHPRVVTVGWTFEDNEFGWRSYLGVQPGTTDVSPYAAPARRDYLSGLPPTWIGVGTADLFHREDVDYAKRLTAAGVLTQLVVVPGAFHGFDIAAARTDPARRFTASRLAAMREFLST
jgi:acetyl esterase/lipase